TAAHASCRAGAGQQVAICSIRGGRGHDLAVASRLYKAVEFRQINHRCGADPEAPGVVMRRFSVFLAPACLCLFTLLGVAVPAQADVFVAVNKSTQSMSVVVDGR